MVDPELIEQLDALAEKYKQRWGKEVDCFAMPSNMSQEKLLLILQRIVDTGESVLVGWEHIYN